MDEIIQILIFVGAMVIMVVQQNVKAKKKPRTSPFPTDETLDEVFPEWTEDNPVSKPKPVTKTVSRKKSHSPATSFRPTPLASPPPPKKGKIHLNNREEAKRAFIYSEIFNRKY